MQLQHVGVHRDCIGLNMEVQKAMRIKLETKKDIVN